MGNLNDIPYHTLQGNLTLGLFVKKVGDDHRESMRCYPHRDDYYLFVLITRGNAAISVDFKEIALSEGEAVIISPMQVHSPVPAFQSVEGWLLAIASEHLPDADIETIARYSLNTSPVRIGAPAVNDLKEIFGILSRHLSDHPVALSLASAIKNLLLSNLGGDQTPSLGRYRDIALRLKTLMEKNLFHEKSPSAYAGMLNISEIYLNEAVKGVTGLNVSSFIRNQIVLYAKRMLVYTTLSAQEIALRLGYDDYAYFSKLFKKETGFTPIQYRKNLR